jgi:hypothetical protein
LINDQAQLEVEAVRWLVEAGVVAETAEEKKTGEGK